MSTKKVFDGLIVLTDCQIRNLSHFFQVSWRGIKKVRFHYKCLRENCWSIVQPETFSWLEQREHKYSNFFIRGMGKEREREREREREGERDKRYKIIQISSIKNRLKREWNGSLSTFSRECEEKKDEHKKNVCTCPHFDPIQCHRIAKLNALFSRPFKPNFHRR